MILLHRLCADPEPFHMNPDLIATVEAVPDTHVSLTTGTKLVVVETPDEVVAAVRAWHVEIASRALRVIA